MSHTPSVRTNADGSTTVDEGLIAISVVTPPSIVDPTVAQVLTPVTADDDHPALAAGTYYVCYAWIDATTGTPTSTSRTSSVVMDGVHGLSISVPTPPIVPDGVSATEIYSDNGESAYSRFVADISGDAGGSIGHPLLTPTEFAANSFAPQGNNTGPTSTLNAPMQLNGSLTVAGLLFGYSGAQYANGISEWNANTLLSQPEITGALSAVTDAAAKAVLTSILAVLVAKGSAKDSTT